MEKKQPDIENMIGEEIESVPPLGDKPTEKIPATNRFDARIAKTIDRIFEEPPETTERKKPKRTPN